MKIFEFEVIESTQDIALQKDFECVVVAKNQTKGRGRFDRTWQSLEGNLFTSIVIKADMTEIFKLVMSVSVAVVEAIGAGQIKWPNDVLINGKKTCGVLIEKGQDGSYVVGVGINIVAAPNIAGLIYPATSLKDEGYNLDRLEVLDKLVKNLHANMQDKELYNKYKANLYGIGKACKINDIQGTLLDVNQSGYILIETEHEVKKVFAGDLLFS